MSDNQHHVTGGELGRALDLVSKQIDSGFAGVHSRLSRLEDDIRPNLLEHGKQIAILEYQAKRAEAHAVAATNAADAATEHVVNSKRSTSNRATAVSAAAAGVFWLVVEIFKAVKSAATGG